MPRLLEELQAGTPVRDMNGSHIGEVRAVYGSGGARTAEFLLVYWTARGEEALVPADEAMHVGERRREPTALRGLVRGSPGVDNPGANPVLHRL